MKEGKLFYAGLDFIWSEKRGWLAIEINTCAQFEGFEKATGINVAGKIVDKLLAKSCGK
jgi:glutathione synthase/RimK-type ligase-like ATP-grasp enzyme